MIYAIGAPEVRRVKFGITTHADPTKRLRDMQVGSPCVLVLIATTEGSNPDERRIHKAMEEHHHHGEWFDLHEDVVGVLHLFDSLDHDALAVALGGEAPTAKEEIARSRERFKEAYASLRVRDDAASIVDLLEQQRMARIQDQLEKAFRRG